MLNVGGHIKDSFVGITSPVQCGGIKWEYNNLQPNLPSIIQLTMGGHHYYYDVLPRHPSANLPPSSQSRAHRSLHIRQLPLCSSWFVDRKHVAMEYTVGAT